MTKEKEIKIQNLVSLLKNSKQTDTGMSGVNPEVAFLELIQINPEKAYDLYTQF